MPVCKACECSTPKLNQEKFSCKCSADLIKGTESNRRGRTTSHNQFQQRRTKGFILESSTGLTNGFTRRFTTWPLPKGFITLTKQNRIIVIKWLFQCFVLFLFTLFQILRCVAIAYVNQTTAYLARGHLCI